MERYFRLANVDRKRNNENKQISVIPFYKDSYTYLLITELLYILNFLSTDNLKLIIQTAIKIIPCFLPGQEYYAVLLFQDSI